LHEPGRRDGAHHADELRVLAAHSAQGFKNRQVRLASAKLLDALAAHDQRLAELGREGLDERRLADSRVAADPENRASARDNPSPRCVQLCERGFAADHERARTARRFEYGLGLVSGPR
jgi:hypothetical protein